MKTLGNILLGIGILSLVVGIAVLAFGNANIARIFVIGSIFLNSVGLIIRKLI